MVGRLYVFAIAAHGEGISGSDRIFIEFCKRWAKHFPINIYVNQEGFRMCQRQYLTDSNITYQISAGSIRKRISFIFDYFSIIFKGIKLGLSLRIENSPNIVIYSASEFWMDSLPCLILKLRYRNLTWVASWFQTAPSPFKGFNEGGRIKAYRFSALLYWLMQLPIKPLIAKYADFVLVNNEAEKINFPNLKRRNRVVVVLGAVDVIGITEWIKDNPKNSKIYDGVFQGRFHPQKGVVELVDIWKRVVDKKPDAKLAMIGDGPLMDEVKVKIKQRGLENNIKLFGYVFDGSKKYQIFSQSRVVVHPAFYDSGGMASAEAMLFGLPCVGFDLESYKSYYPQGMIKVPKGNLESFAEGILNLLDNKKIYQKIATEGVGMIKTNWSWEKRAKEVLDHLTIEHRSGKRSV